MSGRPLVFVFILSSLSLNRDKVYYHTDVKNIASSYYPIINRWINKADGTLKTLALPPDVLFEGGKQGVEKRTGSLSDGFFEGGKQQSVEKRTGNLPRTGDLPPIGSAVDGLA